MKKKKFVIPILTFTLLSGLVFFQVTQKENASADSVNYESLAQYVKNYESTQSLKKSPSIIDEKKYAEQYFFKKYLTSMRLSDSEAKKLAFEKVIEEKALFEKAKNENLLASEVEAKKCQMKLEIY